MKSIITKSISAFVLLLAVTVFSQAADLPTLPPAKNINHGTLPNGITYYIVTNPSYKGMADVALVQKAGYGDESPERRGGVTVRTRSALYGLSHFSSSSPFEFLDRNAIFPSDFGFAKISSDATVYRFENISQDRHPDAVDSTLLMAFDIISCANEGMDELYTPDRQAIIVSGDVNPEAIRGKMDMLSMLISKKEGRSDREEAGWKSTGLKVKALHSWTRNSVSAEYASPRTPRSEMASVLPLVTSRYADNLGIILKRRLSRALINETVPFSSIDYSYTGSGKGPGPEKVRIAVSTDRPHLKKAVEILAETLSALDSEGVSPEEYADIENELALMYNTKLGKAVIENSHYVDNCVSAFLYGASLASDKDELGFFSDRMMDAAASAGLFNNFLSALIDRSDNLTLSCETFTDDHTAEQLRNTFEDAWDKKGSRQSHAYGADTSSLRKASGKLKLRSENPEPLFGGKVWIFSNGLKVIYKQLPGNGFFNYSWRIKSGFSIIPDLKPGEEAYIGEMLGTFKIAGMGGDDFRQMLLSNGIGMETEVSAAEFNIHGMAMASKADLLMKALLSISGDRASDPAAFNRFMDRERMRIAEDIPVAAKLDSMMNRGVMLSGYKSAVLPDASLPGKAMNYFDDIFSRAGDGVLIITGDIGEARLKKALLKYLGALHTEKGFSSRFRGNAAELSTEETVVSYGNKAAVGIETTAPINYTAQNFISAYIASLAAKDALLSAAAECGWNADFSSRISIFPKENLTIGIVAAKADAAGLPASMMPLDSADLVKDRLRAALSSLGKSGITQDALQSYKAVISNYYKSWFNDPSAVSRMLSLRYSYGKDLVSDYDKKIASVSRADVNRIITDLPKGGIAQYIVRSSRSSDFQEVPVKDMRSLHIDVPGPAEGNLAYPFGDATVPADTSIDLSSIPAIRIPDFAKDAVTEKDGSARAETDESTDEGSDAGNSGATEGEGTDAAGAEESAYNTDGTSTEPSSEGSEPTEIIPPSDSAYTESEENSEDDGNGEADRGVL